eukprot:scaffold21357_cov118-Isochrysis_galbana.AAC.2
MNECLKRHWRGREGFASLAVKTLSSGSPDCAAALLGPLERIVRRNPLLVRGEEGLQRLGPIFLPDRQHECISRGDHPVLRQSRLRGSGALDGAHHPDRVGRIPLREVWPRPFVGWNGRAKRSHAPGRARRRGRRTWANRHWSPHAPARRPPAQCPRTVTRRSSHPAQPPCGPAACRPPRPIHGSPLRPAAQAHPGGAGVAQSPLVQQTRAIPLQQRQHNLRPQPSGLIPLCDHVTDSRRSMPYRRSPNGQMPLVPERDPEQAPCTIGLGLDVAPSRLLACLTHCHAKRNRVQLVYHVPGEEGGAAEAKRDTQEGPQSGRPVDLHGRRVAHSVPGDETEQARQAEAVIPVRVSHKDAVDAGRADGAALQLDLGALAHVEQPVPIP